jgi:hypothetical protein
MREHKKRKDKPSLPGEIPVEDSEQYPETGPEGEERQPDPVSAEKAVNPELQPVKERKPA